MTLKQHCKLEWLFKDEQERLFVFYKIYYYLQPFKYPFMKLRPSILVALAFVSMISMSSCVKKYICQCKISYSGQPGLPDTVVKEYDIKDTKKNAKSKCEANSATYQNNGINTNEDCYLY